MVDGFFRVDLFVVLAPLGSSFLSNPTRPHSTSLEKLVFRRNKTALKVGIF